ncbi:MAG: hypothetical protein NC930_08085 [Candidatus Omnitrophica bacterium]|nr:hypothetical protein [Candidatus Omnitrophota bacterium]
MAKSQNEILKIIVRTQIVFAAILWTAVFGSGCSEPKKPVVSVSAEGQSEGPLPKLEQNFIYQANQPKDIPPPDFSFSGTVDDTENPKELSDEERDLFLPLAD